MIATEAASVRWPRRQAFAIGAAAGAVAVAIWLLPASIYIVSWPAGRPLRVALFAPAARLVWLLAAAAVVAAAVIAWSWSRRAIGGVAAAAAPLALLWLWTVPFLPWIPDRLPLLLVLAGPLRWAIAAAALAGAFVRRGRAIDWPRWATRRTVFVVSLAAYLIFGLRHARAAGPGGDEPHYLIIAQSLLADGDLQIENNHRERQYRAFVGGELPPDFMRRGVNGQIYSIHAPGLAVLLLPAYALGGYLASVAMLCLIGALTALAVFDLAVAVAGVRAAALTWLAVCLTVPFVPHSWLLFPEMPGALGVAWATLWLWRPPDRRASVWIWRGAVLAALPWLHTKFIVLTAILAAALVLRLWHATKQDGRFWRLAAAFAAPIAVSTGLWLYSFYVIYGVFDPQAPYGDYVRDNVATRNIPRGVIGLLVDQKFGLLMYSPIYLLAIAGTWLMIRRRDLESFFCIVMLTTVAVFVGGTTRLYMWWGGNSAPARFLVTILPCLAPMIAVAIARMTSIAGRTLMWIWLTASLAISAAGVASAGQELFFSDPHGWAQLLETIQSASPLARSFPTFTNPEWRLVELLPWVAAGLLALLAAVVAGRRRHASPLSVASLAGVTFLVTAAAGTARAAADVRDDTAKRGVIDLLSRYDSAQRRGFEYDTMRQADSAKLLQLATIKLQRRGDGSPGSAVPSQGPFALPAGAYEARVWFAGSVAPPGGVVVSSSKDTVFGRTAGDTHNPAVVPFQLPVSVPDVFVGAADRRAGASISQLEIRPTAVVSASVRENVSVRAIESIEGGGGGYIVYVDDNAYPERGVFWTRGSANAHILVARSDARRVVLILAVGPKAERVRLTIAGRERMIEVAADSTLRVPVDVPADARLVPIGIQSPDWFRPSETDPASNDTRKLGCQVRIQLE